jgi:serine/threonine-protein kinase
VIGALAVAATALWVTRPSPVPSARPARLAITLPGDQAIETGTAQAMALSPDGARIVYSALEGGGRTRLFLRPLDRFDSTVIPGTDGASAPFFSSDGEWVGFFARDGLFKVPVGGGPPLRIGDATPVWSAHWAADNTIVFATISQPNGLWRISGNGGTAERLTESAAEEQHAYPSLLPNGTVLFSIVTSKGWQLAVLSPGERKWRPVGQIGLSGPGAQFVPTGHVVYAGPGGLVAVPFDPDRGEPGGSPRPLIDRVSTPQFGAAYFAVAANGTLLYLPSGSADMRTLLLVDQEGRTSTLSTDRAAYVRPRVSPDGRRIAVAVSSDTGRDIWIHDLRRGARTRLTSEGVNDFPVWSPDGAHVTFYSSRQGLWTLYERAADGSGQPEALLRGAAASDTSGAPLAGLLPGTPMQLTGANPQYPGSWSPDGSALAFEERKASGERDIWILPRGESPQPFLVTGFDEGLPRFSPDGRWLAYVSDESSRSEVYVQPYPGPGEKWLVSIDGGTDPVWSGDGRKLYFRDEERLMVADVQPGASFGIGTPRVLFEGRFERDGSRDSPYDVAPDGERFVIVRTERTAPSQMHIVFNWFQDLRDRILPSR